MRDSGHQDLHPLGSYKKRAKSLGQPGGLAALRYQTVNSNPQVEGEGPDRKRSEILDKIANTDFFTGFGDAFMHSGES